MAIGLGRIRIRVSRILRPDSDLTYLDKDHKTSRKYVDPTQVQYVYFCLIGTISICFLYSNEKSGSKSDLQSIFVAPLLFTVIPAYSYMYRVPYKSLPGTVRSISSALLQCPQRWCASCDSPVRIARHCGCRGAAARTLSQEQIHLVDKR